MSVKSIVAFVPPQAAGQTNAALEKALALGAELSARVVVLSYTIDILGPAATESDEETALAAARAAILARADRVGVACVVVDRTSHAYGIGEVFADHLKVADLGVLGGDPRPHSAQRMLISAAVFDSGRPVILMPEVAPDRLPGRILAAWDGTAAAARALHEAMPLMRLASEVIVVRISEDQGFRSGQSGIEAGHHLARHGIRATFREVDRGKRSVFDTLIETARETGAGLIVCGAVRHSVAHDLIFGSVTSSVLAGESPLPVLLST